MGFGVEGPGDGTEPETVRFCPVLGASLGASKGPLNTALRLIDIAADMKYCLLQFLTAVAISASCAAALRLIWSAFHSRHFSSRSMEASLARFFSVWHLML